MPILIVLLSAIPAAPGTASAQITTRAQDYESPTRHELRHRATSNRAVIGIVERMTGPCHVTRAGTKGRNSISIGLRAFENDILITEELSRMHVRYKDGTYVELGAGTAYQVERIRFKPPNLLPSNKPQDQFDETVFRFHHGLARVTAPDVHALEHFVIKTPSSVIRATGPSDFYLVQLEGDRDLTVRVAKGKIEVFNLVTNESLPVPEGQGAYVKASGVVSKAGTFTGEQLAFLKSRTRI